MFDAKFSTLVNYHKVKLFKLDLLKRSKEAGMKRGSH